MKKTTLLGLPALVPAAVGSWLAQRATGRVTDVVNTLVHERKAEIAAFGFSEAASPATWGLSVSLLLLAALALAMLQRLRAGGVKRSGVAAYLPLLACVVAAALLLAARQYNVSVAKALLGVSHETTAPLSTAGIAADALSTTSTWLWFAVLCAVASAVVVALALAFRRPDPSSKFGRAPWQIFGLCVAALGVGGAQLETIQMRLGILTNWIPSYYPTELAMISSSAAKFYRRGQAPVLFVGPQQIYWRDREPGLRPLASARLLSTRDCAEKLRPNLLGTAARSDRPERFAVVFDEGTTYDGMLCVIRALLQPVPQQDQVLPRAGDILIAKTLPELEWLVRAPPQKLPPPFDVVATEYGRVSFAVWPRARQGETVLAHARFAQDVLRQAASTRDAVLIVPELGADAGTPIVFPEPVALEPSSPSPSTDLRVKRVKLGFLGPGVVGPLPQALVARALLPLRPAFQACWHEAADARNPNLEGRVTARFVIDRDGTVGDVANAGSDMPDSRMIACVLRTFTALTFPPLTESSATIVYSVVFTPVT